MKCASCGGEVASTASFCPHCGERTDNADAVPNDANERPHSAATNRMRPGAPGGSGNQPHEQELWSGTYSPKAMVGPAVGLAILTILALVVGLLAPPFGWMVAGGLALVAWAALGLVLLYRRMSVRYRLTTFRFFHETGLLSRSRHRIEVIDINDVTLAQGLIERMFQVGTIHIQSSDVTHPDLYLPGIENVAQVTDLIDNTRRAERQRRGLFMENIGGIVSS
jgi:membrane protein YdbS with pleckstrin-like domain